jgi:hypothetical protein
MLQVHDEERELQRKLQIVPAEDQDWYLVTRLQQSEPVSGDENYRKALAESSPESGSYILLSTRRRNLKAAKTSTEY